VPAHEYAVELLVCPALPKRCKFITVKTCLLDFFRFNDGANRKLLDSMTQMPEPSEAVRLFSHLVTSQNKWMNRVTKAVDDAGLNWFGPEFPLDQLKTEWERSVESWIDLLERSTDSELEAYIFFTRPTDGKQLKVKVKDVAFQLNCHSVHHRAQILRLMREQGMKPPVTDYIFTAIQSA